MLVSLHVMGTAPSRLPLQRLQDYLAAKYRGVAEFTIGTPVPSLGEPDQLGAFYSDSKFTGKLPQWPHQKNMAIIFTELPIEGNYFARSVKNVSIVTTFEVSDALRGSEFKIWDYLVMKCIQEIFWINCKIHSGVETLPHQEADGGIFHYDRPGCLFNFSNHKLQEQVEKLRWARIDADCAERARVKFTVPAELVKTSQRVLNHLTRPTFVRSFSRLMNVSYLNFLYGAVIGGLLTNLVITLLTANETPTSVWYLFGILALAAVAVPLGWHIYQRHQHTARHAQC